MVGRLLVFLVLCSSVQGDGLLIVESIEQILSYACIVSYRELYDLALQSVILGTRDLTHSLCMLASNTDLKPQYLKEGKETVCGLGRLVILLLQPPK